MNLTALEFDLLSMLVKRRNIAVRRDDLLHSVWGYNYVGETRTVDVHIRRLREKIEPNPAQPEFILTKWGVGYYFSDKD